MIVEMGREMSISAVASIVGINHDFEWSILKHYVDEARKERDLSNLSVLGIDELSMDKHHVYVTLFYNINNRMVIYIEQSKESDVFKKYVMKPHFLDSATIEDITIDIDPSYVSGTREYFPDFSKVLGQF